MAMAYRLPIQLAHGYGSLSQFPQAINSWLTAMAHVLLIQLAHGYNPLSQFPQANRLLAHGYGSSSQYLTDQIAHGLRLSVILTQTSWLIFS